MPVLRVVSCPDHLSVSNPRMRPCTGKQTGSPGEPRGPALDNLAEDVDLLPGQAGQAAQQGGVQGGAAEEGTAEGGTAEGDDLGELQRWRLLHGMLYWAHSNPVPSGSPTPGPPTPLPAHTSQHKWCTTEMIG